MNTLLLHLLLFNLFKALPGLPFPDQARPALLNFLRTQLVPQCSKLVRLSLSDTHTLVLCLRVSLKPTLVEPIVGLYSKN